MPRPFSRSPRASLGASLAAFAFAALLTPGLARAQSEQQQLVDRATLSVQDLMNGSESALGSLRKARAVMICPRVFRAGFFIGGEGGGCVLAARDAGGSWSYPAFYSMGSGSFGLQIGVQDAQFVMMIMTQKGLDAVMDDQFKLGGDATIAVA
jgi:lipid-binding SYLF domain-containing protein